MCGRFAINLSASALESAFQAAFRDEASRASFEANHNFKPTQAVPIITAEAPHQIQVAQWGFVGRIRNPKDGALQEKRFINARGETLDQKRSFKPAWNQAQRCLFLMSHYYEWMATAKGKIPFAIFLKGEEPITVAGLYQVQTVQETSQMVTTLITTKGNHLMELVHNQGANKGRMPAILTEDERSSWLDAELPLEQTKDLIATYPDEALATFPVTKSLDTPLQVDFKEKRALEFYARQYGFHFSG